MNKTSMLWGDNRGVKPTMQAMQTARARELGLISEESAFINLMIILIIISLSY